MTSSSPLPDQSSTCEFELTDSQFQNHLLYELSVQSPFTALQLINKYNKTNSKRKALSLREDFCGSGWLACEWIRQGPKHKAVAIDNSEIPVKFGLSQHVAPMSNSQKKRIQYLIEDVCQSRAGRFDVIVALNFSFFLFKSRVELLRYFKNVKKSLKPGGIFLIDFFGGSGVQQERIRKTQYKNFTYYWQTKSFNPVNNQAYFAIHFKIKGQKIIRNAFEYHFRLWSCPELRELLSDAGFKKTTPFWEGSNAKGGGDAKFTPTEWEENCRVWQSFMVAT